MTGLRNMVIWTALAAGLASECAPLPRFSTVPTGGRKASGAAAFKRAAAKRRNIRARGAK